MGAVKEAMMRQQDDIDRLSEAAPEMLKALKIAANFIRDQDGGNVHTDTGWASNEALAAYLEIHAAIAKATGDQTFGAALKHARKLAKTER